MKRAHVIVLLAAAATPQAFAQTTVRVAYRAPALSSAVTPFAVATGMGWWAAAGIKVELVPMRSNRLREGGRQPRHAIRPALGQCDRTRKFDSRV